MTPQGHKKIPPPELIQKGCKAARGDYLEIIIKAVEWGYRQRCLEEPSDLGQELQVPAVSESITPEENERRLKCCLEQIANLTHEKLVELMGEEWLADYRRQFP